MTDTDHTQPHSTADHTQPQTAAVPFNPFDDDDDTFNTAAVPFNPLTTMTTIPSPTHLPGPAPKH